MFNYEEHESIGCVETGDHATYFFEIYMVEGKLRFVCHDEPEELLTPNDVKEFFEERGDKTFNEQLAQYNLAIV